MLLFPGCNKEDATAIIYSRCERDKQEVYLFLTPFVEITDSKLSPTSETKKMTFPEASGVLKLILELGQVLKAAPWMQEQSWALLQYPLSRGQDALSCAGAASPP